MPQKPLTPLQRILRKELAQASLLYRTLYTPEEIKLLAEVYAEDLVGEEVESVKGAFALHRRRFTCFPTPAHIIALLPECRVVPPWQALPPAQGKKTPGYGKAMCEAILRDFCGRGGPMTDAMGKALGAMGKGLEAR